MTNPESTNPVPEQKPAFTHGRTGKVARLPKPLRDKVSQMMLDGHTYLEIIAALGDDGKHLNEDNLANWKSGGYLEWRREEVELSDVRVRQEYAADLAEATQGTSLCEATSKILLSQILSALREAGATGLQSALAEKPEIYVRLFHAVSRLSTSAIACERHRINEEQRQANLQKEKVDPSDRSITPETLSTVEELLRNH